MLTIQLEVSEELAEKVGLETLIERFKHDLELEKLRLLAQRIHFIPNSDEFYIYAQDADLSVRTAPGRGGLK